MPRRSIDSTPFSRRGFLGAGGSAALLCTLGGKALEDASPREIARADAYASRMDKPASARAGEIGPEDAPEPQPGGVARRPLLDRLAAERAQQRGAAARAEEAAAAERGS